MPRQPHSVSGITVALLCAAVCLPVLAQPLTLVTTNGIAYMSGGVGDESMAALQTHENAFDLKLFLVGPSGSYLSDIAITITDMQGKGVLLTTSEGPVLLADLPSGAYSIKAQKNGQTLEQKITVTRGKLSTVYFRFSGD